MYTNNTASRLQKVRHMSSCRDRQRDMIEHLEVTYHFFQPIFLARLKEASDWAFLFLLVTLMGVVPKIA